MAVEYQNQNILTTECIEDNNNEMIIPSSQLMGSPMNDPFMFEEGENCILNQQDFCYYYYNNQLTPEEQAILAAVTTYDDNNINDIYLNDQINLTWSPGFELQDDNYIVNGGSYSYNDDVIENENFDSYNPFIGQSPMYNDDSLNSGMLLTQPLSEVTQNVIANQQFNQYNDWCDLSPYSDTQQQYIIDDNNSNNINHNNNNNINISTKISEYNNNIINNINSNNNINNNQNYYTAWTDFQLL